MNVMYVKVMAGTQTYEAIKQLAETIDAQNASIYLTVQKYGGTAGLGLLAPNVLTRDLRAIAAEEKPGIGWKKSPLTKKVEQTVWEPDLKLASGRVIAEELAKFASIPSFELNRYLGTGAQDSHPGFMVTEEMIVLYGEARLFNLKLNHDLIELTWSEFNQLTTPPQEQPTMEVVPDEVEDIETML